MKNITLNFEQPLKNLRNEDQPDTRMGQLLATSLAQATPAPGLVMKYWDWSRQMFGGGVLVLDETDCGALRDFIAEHPGMVVMLKAQLLQLISTARDVAARPEEVACGN